MLLINYETFIFEDVNQLIWKQRLLQKLTRG